MAHAAANVAAPPVSRPFDYECEAELFPPAPARPGRQPLGYKRFARASDALRFAIEDLPPTLLLGAFLQVDKERFDARGHAPPVQPPPRTRCRDAASRWPDDRHEAGATRLVSLVAAHGCGGSRRDKAGQSHAASPYCLHHRQRSQASVAERPVVLPPYAREFNHASSLSNPHRAELRTQVATAVERRDSAHLLSRQ